MKWLLAVLLVMFPVGVSAQAAGDGVAERLMEISGMPASGSQEIWLDEVKYTQPIDQLLMHFATPDFYRDWWSEVEKCSGLLGRIDHWKFVSVRAGSFPVKGRPQVGYTFTETKEIWLMQNGANKAPLVKHEMLHALMYDSGMDGAQHPDSLFNGKCKL